jgi:mitogen-activated protein kinase organizer 1
VKSIFEFSMSVRSNNYRQLRMGPCSPFGVSLPTRKYLQPHLVRPNDEASGATHNSGDGGTSEDLYIVMAFPSKPLTQLLGSNGELPSHSLTSSFTTRYPSKPPTSHKSSRLTPPSTGPVHALTYSSSPSSYILTGSSDRTIRLYNPSRPAAPPSNNPLEPPRATQLIQTYSAHGYEVLDISVASDNATFASVGGDRSVFLWDVSTAQTVRRFSGNNGHSARINAVTFAGQGDSVLISGSFDSTVRIWDVKAQNMKPIMVLDDARDSVSCVLAGGKAGEYEILAGSVDGRARCYDLRMGKMETDVIGASVTSLQRTRDGKGVLVGALDNTIRLMDRDGGGLLKSYKGEGWKNEEFRLRSAFGGNERWVLCGNEGVKPDDGEVVVWDTLSGKVAERIRVEGSRVEGKKKIGRDGKEKEKQNVISCVAWKENGRGDQWCCAGTDGIVTVFGPP